jgi:glycosyltransferase involved in cell wall biosynthesis
MDEHDPVVSVVIPAFRCEQVLARALGSLLAQDFRDWEAIIADDGSPDPSWGVMQAYTWLDSRIRAVRCEHRGACAARNSGIAEARGKYLLFLDADDWLENDALRVLVLACETHHWTAAIGGLHYVTQDGTPTDWKGGLNQDAPLFDALCGSNALSVPSCTLVRRSIIDDIGLFDTTLHHCGDWDMWSRLARHRGATGRVDQTVTCYRMSPGSLSRSPKTLLRDATTVLQRLHAPDPRVQHPGLRYANGADSEQLPSRIAHFAVYAAGLAASSGDPHQVSSILDSIAQWPRLNLRRAGEFLFYALCFARCRGPENFREFWDEVASAVRFLVKDLEARSGVRGLAHDLWSEIEICAGTGLAVTTPEPVLSGPQFPARVNDRWETYAGDTLDALARRGSP